MAFKFKVAYAEGENVDQKIEAAIASGKIDAGDLIIVNKGDGAGELRFITDKDVVIALNRVDSEQITTVINQELPSQVNEAVDNKLRDSLAWGEFNTSEEEE